MNRTPHLTASLTAILVFVIAAAGFQAYAVSLEQRYINTLAAMDLSQFAHGSALQRAAFNQADLLPIYGSSEVTLLETPYQAPTFFEQYPTGFMVFEVADMGASSLTIAQSLAAIGPDLRGKKVVISFTPSTVTMGPNGGVNADNYDANFSDLHANEFAFSPSLSGALKKQMAQRMLDFPETLTDDPLLHFAVDNLAADAPQNHLLYELSWPLGELQISLIRLQDHRAVVSFILRRSLKTEVARQPKTIDWQGLVKTAQSQQKLESNSNPYGVDNTRWRQIQDLVKDPLPPGSRDSEFIQSVQNAREWGDLDLALQVLHEMDAKPLIMGRPMNVLLWEALGVSESAQDTYYTRLHAVVDPYQMPLIDFAQYGTDKYFSIDMASHTSRKGWIYVDQTLDAFYHGLIH